MGRRLGHDLRADGLSPQLIQRDLDYSFSRITGAPVIIVVSLSMEDMDDYPDDRRQKNEWTMAVQSASMAGENLLLAAHALELGACWMCAPLFCPETVVDTLSLPSQWQPLGLITLGYPAETKEKSRVPLPTQVRYLDFLE
jgi:F420 biosynthesis protein FbiB-like protein